MSRTRRAGSLVTAGAVAVAALASLAGPAQAKAPALSPQVLKETRAQAHSFWTAERMGRAKAAKMPTTSRRAKPARTLRRPPDGSGRPRNGRRSPSSLPASRSGIRPPRAPRGRLMAGASWRFLELPWKSISYGYTTSQRATGRLFYTPPGGGEGFCSASVVAVNVIVTAAHCVSNGSTRANNSNFYFVPGVNGNRTGPYGGFSAKAGGAFHWSEWNTAPFNCANGTNCEGFLAMDYAFITLKPNSLGYNVGQYTNWYGLWPNAPSGTVYHLGYPGEGSWSGNQNYPYHCKAAPQRWSPYAYQNRYDVGMSCYNTGGSSGGPWLMTYNGGTYVASVQSHMGVVKWQNSNCQGGTCPRFGTTFYGPYFDNDTMRLFEMAKRK